MRGRADDGRDLVISRSYISQGIRARAEERVTLELGPRSEREVQAALENEVEAEYWTNLDRALRNAVDEGAGIANLRPGCPSSDPELRRLMVGRVAKLERLGLAEQVAPGHWTLKPDIQDTLCDLSIRGDIIKTMHRAMTSARRDPDVSSFALHGDHTFEPVLGRLVARGLHNELNGSAFVIVDGIDGKTHHIRFPDLELTGDAQLGAIVEARTLPCSSRLLRRAQPGSIVNCWREGQLSWQVVSVRRFGMPWIVASDISPAKGSLAGRDGESSLRVIC
jgi:type IV secretory pathway VirD2 relaxase